MNVAALNSEYSPNAEKEIEDIIKKDGKHERGACIDSTGAGGR